MMKYETAGDPISGLKWTRKTTDKISNELSKLGIYVSAKTVGKILKNMNYSLKVNAKNITIGQKSDPDKDKKRDDQFKYIEQIRKEFSQNGNPVISVDTKKKELVGNFKNNGDKWDKIAPQVNDHDFPSDSIGKAVPYGIYDTNANVGMVVVGTSSDTPEFAVDCVDIWWQEIGSKVYPISKEILILADSGGSNSARSRVWKVNLQKQFCEKHEIEVTVCHYPSGASKWNPIEHRLFSEVSKNWKGEPLTSFEKILKFISTTKTKTGLKVKSILLEKRYETGKKICEAEMKKLKVRRHDTFSDLNYTLHT